MQRIGVDFVVVGLLMMMLPTGRYTRFPVNILTLPPHLSTTTATLSMKMKVISTDAGASLPAKDGRAEILNSSLEKYSSLTVCARFQSGVLSSAEILCVL